MVPSSAHHGGKGGNPRPVELPPLVAFLLLPLTVWVFLNAPSTARAADSGSTRAAPAPPGFLGASGRLETSLDFKLMGTAHLGLYRTLFHARAATRRKGGPYDWERFDRLVKEATINDVQLLPLLYGTPARVGRDESRPPISGPGRSAQWHRLLVEVVKRYGPNGRFWLLNPLLPKRPIQAWQIWNEPNDPTYWSPAPDPAAFAELLRISARAIRSVDPGATIVSGGITASPSGRHSVAGEEFLAALLKEPGVSRAVDKIGYHPYAMNAKAVLGHLRRARRVINSSGNRKIPLWVTEFGWGSNRALGGFLSKNGEAGQARALKTTIRMILRKRQQLGIERALWYYWRDHPDPFCLWCESAGLLGSGYREKLTLRALEQFTGGRAPR